MPRLTCAFDVTGWDPSPYGEDGAGPALSRATVTRRFRDHLEGTSTAELLLCQADPDDLSAGAGFVGSEVVDGELSGRRGTFVMQHGGLSGGSQPPRTFGSIVPGSGTGELEGITGSVEIGRDADGGHTLTLEYDLPHGA